jgi:gliding motility-associated-like protein
MFKKAATIFLFFAINQLVAQTIQLPLSQNRLAGSNKIIANKSDDLVYSSAIVPPAIFFGSGKTANLTSFSLKKGLLWSEDYDFTKKTYPTDLSLFENGYLLSTFVIDENQNKGLIRLDEKGKVLWSKRYGVSGDLDTINQGFNRAIALADGNIALAGGAAFFANDLRQNNIYLSKIDKNGKQIWANQYCFSCNGNQETILRSLVELPNGGFLLCGSILLAAGDGEKILLIKTDKDGNLTWVKTYNNPNSGFSIGDQGVQVKVLPNGNYALMANQKIFLENNAGIIAELNSNGKVQRALRIRVAPTLNYTLQLNELLNDGNDALIITAGVTQDSTPNLSKEQNLLFKIRWNGTFDWKHNYYDEVLQGFGTATSSLTKLSNGTLAQMTNFAEGLEELYPILIVSDDKGKTGCEKPINMTIENNLKLDENDVFVVSKSVLNALDYPISSKKFDFKIEIPTLNLPTDTTLCKPFDLALNVSNSKIEKYTWSTGEKTPSISVKEFGLYSVTATSAAFCLSLIDTIKVSEKVNCNVVTPPTTTNNSVFIPSIFSPNDDANNDTFFPFGEKVDVEIFRIYDRWGELVFEAKTPTDAWNGKFREQEVPSDVYVYFIQAKVNGELKKYKGDITLIR